MTYDEYLQKSKELKSNYELSIENLMKEFVDSNNSYKIGDKVTDHIGTIMIEKMGYSWGYSNDPCATYTGIEIKKDGTPKKSRERRTVWQNNIR